MRPLAAFRRFLRDETGSSAIEALIMLPLMMWCFLGVYVFFDAFRAQATNIRTAYTIGDMLSRETNYITPNYMDSLARLQNFLASTTETTAMRVTVFHWDANLSQYRVNWSQGRDGPGAMTNAKLAEVRDFLPNMPTNEIAILVQTWVDYDPTYGFVGIEDFTFSNFVVTRPRFAGQLCWNTQNSNGTQATATC